MRLKLTDKRIEKFRSKSTIEVWDTDLRGLGIRINRGGKRTFNVHTRVNGKKKRFVLGTYPYLTIDEARRQAECIIHGAPNGHRTFGEICEQFLVDYVLARQWRTKSQMERHIRHVLIPMWGDRHIVSITRAEVRDFFRDYAKDGPIAANRLLAQLRKIFNWALDEELITSSPVTRLTPPAPERERDRVLSADEVALLWSQFDGLGYPFGPLFKLLLTTGQRRGEVVLSSFATPAPRP